MDKWDKVIGFLENTMATSSEGKRLSTSSSKFCESCHINPAIKYCAECPIHLCDICTRGHRNLKYTKDHVLSDIGACSTTSVSPSTTTRGCHKHNNSKFTTCCAECVQLICNSCKNDHKGHELVPLTSDAKLHQKVCGKKIQNLLDDLHEIDGMKTILESHVTTYEDAIRVVDNWELDLLQMVKNKAAKLRKKLTELKDKKYKQLSDKVKGLMVQLQEIDQSITKLNSIRKSVDTQFLENEVSAAQELIDKLEGYKCELQPLPSVSKVEIILPNGDLIRKVDTVLEELFTDGELDIGPRKGPNSVAEWKFTASNGGRDISKFGENPVKLNDAKYGPGPRGERNEALIFSASNRPSIVVENPTNKLKFPSGFTFYVVVLIEEKATSLLELLAFGRKGVVWLYVDSTSVHVEGIGVSLYANNVLTPGHWHKVAIVVDISSVAIYVDGKLANSSKGAVDFSEIKNGPLCIGKMNDYDIKVRMASAKLFNVALTKDQIEQISWV